MPALKGKVAVIRGGSSGIGLAAAERFVKEGAYVFITGRRQSELDKAVAQIGSNITAVKGDVSNVEDRPRCSWRRAKVATLVESICRSMAALWPCRREGTT